MQNDFLDRPAERKTVIALRDAGLLSAAATDEALRSLRPPLAWWRWISRLLLLVGVALVLTGVAFFFAYNWARMATWTKFALIEGALAGCVLAAWLVGIERLAGKLLALAAAAFTGMLLAVYGQTYQTGADAYELFLGWALLILGWVVILRFGALWIMWLAILNTGVILYWTQVLLPNETASFASLCILLTFVNGAALALRELGAERGIDWIKHLWLRHVLLLAVLAYPTMSTVGTVVEANRRHFAGALAVLVWLGVVGLAFWFYRCRARDLHALPSCALSTCIVVLSFLGKALFESSTEAPMLLLFGLLVLAVVGGAATWLQWTSRQMAKES